MKKTRRFMILLILVSLVRMGTGVLAEQVSPSGTSVVRIVVDGPISPVTADYIERGIEKALEEDASLLILELDTPGGLMTSTRQIVKALLGAEVPIAVHVAPPGARAASAGVFITMASHVAVMAPGTNIGAAHPVNVGGGNPLTPKKEDRKENNGKRKEQGAEDSKPNDGKSVSGEDKKEGSDKEDKSGKEEKEDDPSVMSQKVLNDAVAFVRSIAQKRERNADWAEKAVRESVSVTEREALELNVVDFIAESTEDLLAAVHGRTVEIAGNEVTLNVADARVVEYPMGWRHRVLMALSDPNIAYILMMLGIYGLFFELSNPGVILPGVLGSIFLILAFFSFQVLPINYAGLLLIIVALVLFILEVKVVSYGMLSVGGAVALFLGSIMLFESAEPYYRLSLKLVVSMTALTVLFFAVILGFAIRIQRRKPTTGLEGLLGEPGVVTVALNPEGKIKVHGEICTAWSDSPLPKGTRVKVTEAERMKLKVVKETEKEVLSPKS